MLLGGRYELLETIRRGMATVYRGQDLHNGRIIGVKVLGEWYTTNPEFETLFQQEMKVKTALHHPNIVQIYDYGESSGVYYIVMELIEGTDLRRYLRSRGILSANQAAIIAHDVALGLGATHRRDIVSRNVIPQRILIVRNDIKLFNMDSMMTYGNSKVKLLMTTIAGVTLGTVECYAPEQVQGESVTPAADVYALGIVMYEMLTGRTPFDGDTPVAVAMQHIQNAPMSPSQFNPNIPPALEAIILRCLEKVPEMRYRNGSVLAQALEAFMEETF
jgi:serine/threonine protein kinase